MYFPEGIWNLSPNLPMLPLYWGIVNVAQQSNAIIIPVAAEQYGKRFKVNIGKNVDLGKYGTSPDEKTKAINAPRDILPTLKWEIWESEPLMKRSEIRRDEWDKHVSDRLKEWPYPDFDLEYVDDLTYKPKNIVDIKTAFEHLEHITANRDTAFLYNKKLK